MGFGGRTTRQVLGDFELTTDVDIYRYPERYRDCRTFTESNG